jgi:hypothetical protein
MSVTRANEQLIRIAKLAKEFIVDLFGEESFGLIWEKLGKDVAEACDKHKRTVRFTQLKTWCYMRKTYFSAQFKDYVDECNHSGNRSKPCCEDLCPVWKRWRRGIEVE